MTECDVQVSRCCLFRNFPGVTRETAPARDTGLWRQLAIPEFPRQDAERQWGIRQQSHVFANRHFRQPDFKTAIQQIVGILNADHTGEAALIRNLQETMQPPGRFVG